MSIKRAAVFAIVLPCVLPGGASHAGPCDRTPCAQQAAPSPSPIDSLKSLFGVKAEEPAPAAKATPARPKRAARKVAAARVAVRVKVPLPRARPLQASAPAPSPKVFAAAAEPSDPAAAGPARLVHEAFNELAVRDRDEHPILKSARVPYRAAP